MSQIQFLLDNLDESDDLQDDLARLGVAHNDVHFLTKHAEEFQHHHVHSASLFEERDIIHSGLRGAILGLFVSIFIIVLSAITEPWGWDIQLEHMILMGFFLTAFGGWLGGLYGIGHQNYRVAPYYQHLEDGKALMLVYSSSEKENSIRRTIESKHPLVRFLGSRETYDNPLVSGFSPEIN